MGYPWQGSELFSNPGAHRRLPVLKIIIRMTSSFGYKQHDLNKPVYELQNEQCLLSNGFVSRDLQVYC